MKNIVMQMKGAIIAFALLSMVILQLVIMKTYEVQMAVAIFYLFVGLVIGLIATRASHGFQKTPNGVVK